MPKQSDSTADFTSTTILEAQKNILKGKYCFEEEKKNSIANDNSRKN